jgi:lipoprotein NlpD
MKFMRARQSLTVLSLILVFVLSACSSKPRTPVPVEDRVAGSSSTRSSNTNVTPQPSAAVAVSTPVSMGSSLPGSENAGKPGYYSVRAGDTLTKIALDHGQGWRDIAKWNGLDNPNVIEIDQVLRVVPPTVEAGPSRQAASKPATGSSPATTPSAPAATPSTSSASNAADDGLGFAWPHPGQVVAGFDEAKNKGLDFAGKAGDPVLAAADGKVVYAGAGLRGYGNLVILKHNNTYLSAYAHNQTLLVKEDQNVTKGQRIAEMGSTDTDRVKLHFEIRKQGKPVDPSKYLPARP